MLSLLLIAEMKQVAHFSGRRLLADVVRNVSRVRCNEIVARLGVLGHERAQLRLTRTRSIAKFNCHHIHIYIYIYIHVSN